MGIFNAKFFLFAFKNYYAGDHLGSRGVKFKSEFMKVFPIPPITDANQPLVRQIEKLVDEIIATKTATPDADFISLENEIDRVVYSLYGLTTEDIAIVEESR